MVFTQDHKRLGVMYLWRLIFFVLAAIASFLIRFEHLSPGSKCSNIQCLIYIAWGCNGLSFYCPRRCSEFWNFLIPLMIGARCYFSKLNLYSFWIYCAGSLILLLPLAAPILALPFYLHIQSILELMSYSSHLESLFLDFHRF